MELRGKFEGVFFFSSKAGWVERGRWKGGLEVSGYGKSWEMVGRG